MVYEIGNVNDAFPINCDIGSRLVAERNRLGMSQTDLRNRMGVGKNTQVNYESGKSAPDALYLAALDRLGFDVLYIITGDRATGSQLSEQQQNLIDIWEAASMQLRDAALAVLLSPHHPEILKRERDIPGRFAHGVLDQDTPRFEYFMQIYRRFRQSPVDRPTVATRYEAASTTQNLDAILDLLKNPALASIVLFATEEDPVAGFNSKSDGPDTNLPLVAALVELEPKGIEPMFVVFDGCFLTGVRPPRYTEVRFLLDAAIGTGKAFFGTSRVPFTSSLPPEAAANVLIGTNDIEPLDGESRPRYIALLSKVAEVPPKR